MVLMCRIVTVIVIAIAIFFLDKSVQGGKVQIMRLTLCEVPTRETRPDHNTGNSVA